MLDCLEEDNHLLPVVLAWWVFISLRDSQSESCLLCLPLGSFTCGRVVALSSNCCLSFLVVVAVGLPMSPFTFAE